MYEFFDKWSLGKIMLWVRIIAYSYFIVASFEIKAYYNDYLDRLPFTESAPQVTQIASESTIAILHSFTNIVVVGLILIALEIQWAGKRRFNAQSEPVIEKEAADGITQ